MQSTLSGLANIRKNGLKQNVRNLPQIPSLKASQLNNAQPNGLFIDPTMSAMMQPQMGHGSQNPSTRYRDHMGVNFANQQVPGAMPGSTKNTSNQRNLAIKKQLASNQRVSEGQQTYNAIPIQTIQNITNYHIDMP